MNWDSYARLTPHNDGYFEAEPVQGMRAATVVARAKGSVLDVGGGDGFIAEMIRDAGHRVEVRDISSIRVERCRDRGIKAEAADAAHLPDDDGSFDTVVLGEILEHLDDFGPALSEACRVARHRVVVSLPLNGWADPTHKWRIRLDVLRDPDQHAADPTKGEQIVLTFERGACWPEDYMLDDPSWFALFEER